MGSEMRIRLSGGRFNGQELEVSGSLSVLSFPLLSLGNDHAAIGNDIKRHSWDDGALLISYLDYYKTHLEADDGTVIFVPKDVALHYA